MSSIVLQNRDRELFKELSVLRVADRDLLTIAGGFGSVSRVNVRLLQLARAKLLRRFFIGGRGAGRKALYSLTAKAALLVDVPLRGPRRKNGETLVADFFVEHQLEINHLYCALKFGPISAPGVVFRRWVAFTQPLTNAHALIPDGYFELGTPAGVVATFLEVDLGHESLRVWNKKVQAYLNFAMSGNYREVFGASHFRVAVVANSERRLHSIRKAVAVVTEKIFWFATIEAITKESFFGPIWFRPTGVRAQRFMEHV